MKVLKFIGKQLYILLIATIFSYMTAGLIINGVGSMMMMSNSYMTKVVAHFCKAPTRGA